MLRIDPGNSKTQSRCFLQLQSLTKPPSQSPKSFIPIWGEKAQTMETCTEGDMEEVDYGSSSIEGQENSGDFDWDQECFVYD